MRLLKNTVSLLLIFSIQTSCSALANEQDPPSIENPLLHNACPANLQRPCIALALGGGGARGSAHIGVIKAIEELGIPVDIVVGTSIGAFVGGLYASGKTSDDILKLFQQANWSDGYRDALSRSDIPNRRKRQLDNIPIRLDLGFDGKAVKLPKGFLQGQGMKSLIDSMLGSYLQFKSFDELPKPFRAIAADAETGKEVILKKGDLATALQISMSIPGVVRPIERNGQMLVDGGIANNLPISVAKAMGADIVIAVDIGSPSLDKSELQSGIAILRQMISFLTQKNVAHQKTLLSKYDVLLEPHIEDIGMLSFNRSLEALEAGYQEALKQLKINGNLLAIAEEATKTAVIVAEAISDKTITIDTIKLRNHSRLTDDYLLNRMNFNEGMLYTPDIILNGTHRLYGQGTIARITTSVEEINNQNQLNIHVEEKEWGPGYVDFKLAFEDDFSSLSRYQFGISYRLTNLSAYGAEWYTTTEFGTDKKFFSEYYSPIKNTGLFWNTSASFERLAFEYKTDDTSFGEVINSQSQITAGLGWAPIDDFDLLVAAKYTNGIVDLPKLLSTTTNQDELDYNQKGLQLNINFDNLDSANFPKEGWKFQASLSRTKDQLVDVVDYSTELDIELNGVISAGRNSLRGLLRVQSTINEDPLSLLGAYSLGGFLNLSGNVKSSIVGQHVRFTSLTYTYELIENNFGAITLPLYLGLSVEAGNAWNSKKEIDFSELIHSSSAFIGWDSPLGPAYLAYGHSDTGEKSLYVFLGVVF